MNRLLCLLLLLLHASKAINIWAQEDLEGEEEEEFIKNCQTNSFCGGIDIRYTFRLNSTPAYCGAQGLEISCSAAGDAIITLPGLGPCKAVEFDNYFVRIEVQGDEWARCPLQKLSSTNLTGSIYDDYSDYRNLMLVNCSSEIETDPDWITGPIPCLGNGSEGQWVYAAYASASMDKLPSGCVGTGNGGWIGYAHGRTTFGDQVQQFIRTLQIDLYLNVREWGNCGVCYSKGKECVEALSERGVIEEHRGTAGI